MKRPRVKHECQFKFPALHHAEKDSLTSHSSSSAHHSGSINSPNLLNGLSPRAHAGSVDVVDLQCARTSKFLSPHAQAPSSPAATISLARTPTQISRPHRPPSEAFGPRPPALFSFPAFSRCARKTAAVAWPPDSSSRAKKARTS